MKRIRSAAIAWIMISASHALAADTSANSVAMAHAANGFYAAYATFHPSDGMPDAKGRARYEPFISPALDKLLSAGDAAEDKFARENKDSPPLIEGDLFTSNFEGATSSKIGPCEGDDKTGQCRIDLVYDDSKANPKDKPLHWTDTVYLVDTDAGWRVNDIGYGGSWDFGNKGRLSGTLKMAIHDTGN